MDHPNGISVGLLRLPQGPDRSQLVPRHRRTVRAGLVRRGQGLQYGRLDLVTTGTHLGRGAGYRPRQGGGIAQIPHRFELSAVHIAHISVGIHLQREDVGPLPLGIRCAIRQYGPALHLPGDRGIRTPGIWYP